LDAAGVPVLAELDTDAVVDPKAQNCRLLVQGMGPVGGGAGFRHGP